MKTYNEKEGGITEKSGNTYVRMQNITRTLHEREQKRANEGLMASVYGNEVDYGAIYEKIDVNSITL